jgi:hypothetical protein
VQAIGVALERRTAGKLRADGSVIVRHESQAESTRDLRAARDAGRVTGIAERAGGA